MVEGGAYSTADDVANLREGNYAASAEKLRPAILIADAQTQRVPVRDVRQAMLRKLEQVPDASMTPEDRAWARRQIEKRYADGSAAGAQYRDGYSLTNFHDSRIAAAKNGKYKPDGTHLENRPAELSRMEGQVFNELFEKSAPADLPWAPFKRELEERFRLADYLELLHNKRAPEGVTKKAARLFGRAVAATVGGKVGGFPGSILGAQYGDILFSTFEALPNPLKRAALERVLVEEPAVFREIANYLGEAETRRLMTPRIGATSSYKEPAKRMFSTPKGVTTDDLGEAVDVAAVETGRARKPGTDRRKDGYRGQKRRAEEAQEPYADARDLPVVEAGKKPKRGASSKKERRIREVYGDLPSIR